MEFNHAELPFLKRVFQLPTQTPFETDQTKMRSLSSQAESGGSYCNDFHDWLVYREPSAESLGKVDRVIASQSAHDVTNIQFTSGTTGLPKAASLTHHNIVNNAISVGSITDTSLGDRLCLTVPLYHCFGMVLGSLLCLGRGSALVLPWPTFDPEKSLETVEKWQCSMIYGVPTMFIELVKTVQTRAFDLGSLSKAVIGGSICPRPLILDMEKHLGISSVHIGYGMTETSPASFMVRKQDPIDKKSTTVGKTIHNLETKIVSPDGLTVEVGEIGELAIKGYSVMPGYFNDAENTAKSIVDGWMMTGDLARFDANGFLTVEGRIKDLITRGGENVSPKEVEQVIAELPQVENVQVIGVPDPKFQEEVCALVKLRPDARLDKAEVLNYVKPLLSHFKLPKYVKFVDDFPITVTGKPQKFKMIEDWVRQTETLTDAQIKEQYGVR